MGEAKKIEIATDEEVRQYAADDKPAAGDAKPSAETEDESPEPTAPEQRVSRDLAEAREKLLRAKADFQNLQRRTQQEKIEARRFANAEFARALLGVLDDFERAIEASKAENATAESVLEGVELVYAALRKVLADHEITEINPGHEPFDPRVHEAVMQQSSEEHPNMTVLQTAQKGYQLHDRVLRPAKVIVSRSEAQPSADTDNAEDGPSARQPETE